MVDGVTKGYVKELEINGVGYSCLLYTSIVLDSLSFGEIKTKNMVNVLRNLGVDNTALVVIPEKDLNVVKSASNIKGIETAYVNTINVYDILRLSLIHIWFPTAKCMGGRPRSRASVQRTENCSHSSG